MTGVCVPQLGLAALIAALIGEPAQARAGQPGNDAAREAHSETPGAPTRDAVSTSQPAPYIDLLTLYKDNYFLTGFTMAREVKFQFSAKFDIWPNRGRHALYFAFSQKSLWDIYRKSQPFLENDYAPELFYSYFHVSGRYDPPSGCGFFFERLGVIHESNGQDAAGSRGWNRVYGESRYACYDSAQNYAMATLQLWLPFAAPDNPNIARYLGYGELSIATGSDRGEGALGDWELALHVRKGTRSPGAGSLELDARWRPRYGEFWRFTPYLYGQVFTGYGETLLSYDRSLTALRFGIAFTERSTRAQ
jgi:outer membrane phospholipase A